MTTTRETGRRPVAQPGRTQLRWWQTLALKIVQRLVPTTPRPRR